MSIKNGCGNKKCGVSTGICGSTTFGSGKLDDYGYWKNPCRKCAKAFEESTPKYKGRCWPRGKNKKQQNI